MGCGTPNGDSAINARNVERRPPPVKLKRRRPDALRVSRIVELHDRQPLLLKKAEMERNVVAICRCGLSAAWPFCDGSHSQTTDEQPGELAAYTRNDRGELQRRPADAQPGAADPRKGLPREK